MLKLIASAVLASSFALTSTSDALAGGGEHCGSGDGCGVPTAECATQHAAPATPAAVPSASNVTTKPAPQSTATAQSSTFRYRSYSYGTAPAARARQMPQSGSRYSSPYDQFRADRKVRGLQ